MGGFGVLKWGVLAVYSLAAVAGGLDALSLAVIAKKVAAFYGVSFNLINQVTIAGLLCPFLGTIPAMYLADRTRFEIPFYLALLVAVGSRWGKVFLASNPSIEGFWMLFLFQSVSALVAGPLLNCVPPVLSHTYFPPMQQGVATSAAMAAPLVGFGAGLVVSPLFEDDIPGLYLFQAVAITIPLLLSVFALDICGCCTKEQIDQVTGRPVRSTSVGRLVRGMSTLSTPSSLGFSPYRPEEHVMVASDHELPLSPDLDPRSHRDHHAHLHRGVYRVGLVLPFVFNSRYRGDSYDDEEDYVHGHLGAYSAIDASVDRDEVERRENRQEKDQPSYFKALRVMMSVGSFVRLTISISLLSGVIMTWMALVNEVAPKSMDNASSTQLFTGLFFGCGTIGAILMGLISDRVKDYSKIGRASLIINIIPSTTAMLGWHFDNKLSVLIGVSCVGLFGFGLLPLAIEFGIELVHNEDFPGMNAAVAGVVQSSMNVAATIIIFLTTPGNIPHLTESDIPLVWLGIFWFGGILWFTVPSTILPLD